MSENSLAGKIALVTGASRGIGQACAIQLAQAGAHVILTGRTQGGLEATEQKIHELGGTSTIAPLDLLKGDQIDALAAAVAARWPQLDILVLNAALLGSLTPLGMMAPDDFDRIFATNVHANYRLIRAFDLLLRQSRAARIIALTSSVAQNPRPYWGPYAASKAALENLVASFAQEVVNISAIRNIIVDPSATRTKMRASAFPGEDPQSIKSADVCATGIIKALQNSLNDANAPAVQQIKL